MSLINQALRKVQSERSESNNTIGSRHQRPLYAENRGITNKTGLLIGLSVCVFVLIGLVAGLTFILIRKDPQSIIAETYTPKAQTPSDTIIDLPSDPKATSMIHSLPTATQATAPEIEEKRPEETPNAAEPKVPAAKPNQEIIQWLSQSTVNGIWISKNRSKVLLNDSAFTIGDTVNFDLDLKLLLIEEKRLLFIDSNNVEYTKQL